MVLALALGCTEQRRENWTNGELLAQKLDHPSALLVDGGELFFTTGGTIASLNSGTAGVWKLDLADKKMTEVFRGYKKDDRTVYIPNGFILGSDDKYVYWTTGTIWRAPKGGGEPQEITTGSATEMLVDEISIYWHNYTGEGMSDSPVYQVSKGGGTAKSLTGAANISDIAIDDKFLYWSQPDGIYKVLKTGGDSSKIYSPPDGEKISAIASDESHFYLIKGSGKPALCKVPKSGGEATLLAPSVNNAHKIQVDNSHVYFVMTEGSFGTSINKVSKNGGDILKLGSGHISSFAVGKDKVYVSDISNIYQLAK
jgi:hypothetical protein